MPRLDDDECRRRFAAADHLVLGTLHPERGVDLVPAVFAVDGDLVWIPIDAVKPKASARLQRLANIERDPRVTLLTERYDDDWSQLWWVRATGRARETDARQLARARTGLAARYPAYADPASITTAIAVTVERWSGWTAR